MTKLIAFSGVGNTGKSTLIKKVKEEFDKRGIKGVYLSEVARDVMKVISPKNTLDFQNGISIIENERVKEIKELVAEGLYDVIVCDRTWLDNVIYANFNIAKGKMKGEVNLHIPDLDYDKVILLDTPIKETSTPEFEHYNDRAINQMMLMHIRMRFKDVSVYENGKEDTSFILKELIGMFENSPSESPVKSLLKTIREKLG